MTDKEKQAMFGRIIGVGNNNSTNIQNNKKEMYNRIISNYNNYKSNKTTNSFSSVSNREKFKNGSTDLNIEKTKKAENINKKIKEGLKNIIINKNKTDDKKNNILENTEKFVTATAAVPLSFTPIGTKIGTDLVKKQISKDTSDAIKYVGKRAGTGVLGGLNGILKAGTTEMQNNMQKGKKENKNLFDNITDIAKSAVDLATGNSIRNNLAEMAKKSAVDGFKTLTNKNSNPIQKVVDIANNATTTATEMVPGKKLIDNTFKMFGNTTPNKSDKVIENASNLISKPYDDLNNKLYEEGKKYNKAIQTAGNVSEVVGNMAPTIGASMVAGPEMGLLTTAVSAKGNATEEALTKGAQLEEAVKIGNTKGMVEAGTELISGGINFLGKGALDDIVEKGLINKISNKVGKFLAKQGYDFAGEVGEEVVSDVVGTLIDKGTVDPNATYSVEQLGDTAVTTILSTAVLKALGVPVNKLSNKLIDNAQKKLQSNKSDVSELTETQNNNDSNINNRLEDKNTQNPITKQIEGDNINIDNYEQENINNQTNMKNKAQNYINRSKNQFINDLVSNLQTSKYSNKEVLNQSVNEIINEINNNDGKVSKEKADELFDNLYSKLVKTDSDYYNQYKDLKDDLRKTKIFVPENVANDITDFGEFRKINRGNLVLTNDNSNVNIDTKYNELSETYPELFPTNITNQSDQLQKISEVVRDIKKTETNVQAYLDKNMGSEYKMWAREDFTRILDKFQKDVNMAYRYNADKTSKSKLVIAKDELKEMYKSLPKLQRQYDKVMSNEVLTKKDQVQVDRLIKNEITPDELPKGVNVQGIMNVYNAKLQLQTIKDSIKENKKNIRAARLDRASEVLGDLSKWKDKSAGWKFSRETATRNIFDVAPKDVARKIDNEYIQPYHQHEAQAVRLQNEYVDKIADLKLSTAKKYKSTFSIQEIADGELKDVIKTQKVSEAELVQIFGEGRITLEQLQETGANVKKITNAVDTFRNIYSDLFDKTNEVLLNNGLEPIQKRENYFPHFTEDEPDGLLATAAKIAGIDLSGELLPTDIAGKTQNFKPNKKFVGNFLARKTDITNFNVLEGFDRYINGVSDVIYHTEDIMKFRAMSDSIRNFYSTKEIQNKIESIEENSELSLDEKAQKIKEIKTQTMNKSNLSNFITWLDNYINILSGKKSINDRGAEKELSRKMYKTMNKIEGRIGANMVAGNFSVSLTNMAALAQSIAEIRIDNLAKGLWGSMIANGKSIIGKRDTSFASDSDFITRRRGAEHTNVTFFEKLTKPLDIISAAVDDVTSEAIVKARYIQNLKNGMTQQESIQEADKYAAGLMTDRSKGALPTMFSSTNPLAKMVNMFQAEVNNQYSYYFKDLPRNMKTDSKATNVAKLTYAYAKLLIGSYAMNDLISKVRGNATRVLPDPVYLVKKLIEGLGDDDDDNDWETIQGTMQEVIGNTPFMSAPAALFGSAFGFDTKEIGRVSISGAIPDISKIGKAAMDKDANADYKKETISRELKKPVFNLIFPKAGAQVKKTMEGAEVVINGGSYSTSKEGEKKLQFKVDKNNGKDVAKALMFGKWSTSQAQNYTTALSAKEQKEMEELNLTNQEYNKYRNDKKALNKIESDKDEKGKTVQGSANAKKAYKVMHSTEYSDDEKKYLINSLNSEESKYKISTSTLKKLEDSEENYKYFYSISNEKQKEFISDMKKYNFKADDLVKYYSTKDKINDKYTKETDRIKEQGYRDKIQSEKLAEINAKKKKEISDNLVNSNFNNEQKLLLYYKSYKTNDVDMARKLNMNADSFIKFDNEDFESTYTINSKGKKSAVKKSKLTKVVSYVNNLPNLNVEEKAILIKSEISTYKKYDSSIVKYIDSKDYSLSEKTKMLENLGFKVKDGKVY